MAASSTESHNGRLQGAQGVYVKVGNDGFHDAGWRVGPRYTVCAGPAEFNPDAMMNMSFVGAFGNTVL